LSKHLFESVEVLNDTEVAVLLKRYPKEGDLESSAIVKYDLLTGKASELWSESVHISMRYNAISSLFEFTVYTANSPSEMKYTISPKTGRLKQNPDVALSVNQQWTLYRHHDRPGIWAKSNDDVASFIQLTKNTNDGSPLWIPGTNSFVYLAATGRSLGDGLGPEHALAVYDVDKRQSKTLAYKPGYINIIGWADPGRKLIIDRTNNEGADHSYTDPAIVVLVGSKESQILPDAMRAYDLTFNAPHQELVVSIPDYTVVYGSDGQIRSLFPDNWERSAVLCPR
jgi:hypothetical protein